jgi:hypothetical protein
MQPSVLRGKAGRGASDPIPETFPVTKPGRKPKFTKGCIVSKEHIHIEVAM